MEKNAKNLLIVDDEENMRHMLSALLTRLGYATTAVPNGRTALNLLSEQSFDVILCDIRMPEMDGLEFLQRARESGVEATIIMMSAFGSVDTALSAMRLGAYDYISKPFKAEEIELTLKKAEERESLRRDNQALRQHLAQMERDRGFGTMLGKSAAMLAVFTLAAKVAPHATTVLVTGESGTGKELVAQGIHQQSGRATKRFVAINCGGLPENLIESELFGHVKGAFTGADKKKEGLFAEADGGTLFLDEIGELALGLQVKLLRVLQEGEIRPIGGNTDRKVDVRVIAATSRNLEQDIQQGLFRQDLYYRLNVVHIQLPPLRERSEDIPLLADFFVERYARRLKLPVLGIASTAMTLLLRHTWPGNVRELENVIERAVILADQEHILPENLPKNLRDELDFFVEDGAARDNLSIKQAQKNMERNLIRRALAVTGGNKSRAAELLEISYPSLLSKIKDYSLDGP